MRFLPSYFIIPRNHNKFKFRYELSWMRNGIRAFVMLFDRRKSETIHYALQPRSLITKL